MINVCCFQVLTASYLGFGSYVNLTRQFINGWTTVPDPEVKVCTMLRSF